MSQDGTKSTDSIDGIEQWLHGNLFQQVPLVWYACKPWI